MLDRQKIIEKAFHDCMKEMYARSQPSVDYDQLLEDAKSGKIGKDEAVYERYYLSTEEFNHIRWKYIEAYNIKESWTSNIELLEKYLNEGGTKDKYIKAHTDEYGYHPGYRGYEKVAPIRDQIQQIIKEEIGDECVGCGNKIADAVMNIIKNCKEFYKFDREESSFSCSLALGASPSSNPETVKKYWKTQGIDIDIEIRNPLLFWDQEYYGDEFEDVMIEEYGENWKEIKDNEWKEKINRENEEREKRMQELLKLIKNKEKKDE